MPAQRRTVVLRHIQAVAIGGTLTVNQPSLAEGDVVREITVKASAGNMYVTVSLNGVGPHGATGVVSVTKSGWARGQNDPFHMSGIWQVPNLDQGAVFGVTAYNNTGAASNLQVMITVERVLVVRR